MDFFVLIALIASFFSMLSGGTVADCSSAIVSACFGAVENVLGMLGAMTLFCGITEVLRQAGAVKRMERLLRKPTAWLLGRGISESARENVIMNYSLNLLGLGNAATPYGLKAMEEMKKDGSGKLCEGMLEFILLNLSAVQLLPVTLIALRAAAGSANSEAIVLPVFVSTVICTLLAAAIIALRKCRCKKVLPI
ncbi:MAG: hypothetical protein PHI27_07040 [Eubacteriales bacterium]|nr:hypothetical protein [Eubacteriales bacterium]MDD3881991.1 hypothetical protein [Eubacteriales bacterium]MDD4513108.1 hypothetical protein [Eubacteriales bacterium]